MCMTVNHELTHILLAEHIQATSEVNTNAVFFKFALFKTLNYYLNRPAQWKGKVGSLFWVRDHFDLNLSWGVLNLLHPGHKFEKFRLILGPV